MPGITRRHFLKDTASLAAGTALDAAVRLCEELGHELIDATPELDMHAAMQASGTLSVAGLAERVALREAQLGRKVTAQDLEPVNLEMLAWGRKLSAVDYLRAQQGLRQTAQDMARFMENVDLLLSPTMTWAPPRLGVVDMALPLEEFGPVATRSSVFTVLYNITGQPALVRSPAVAVKPFPDIYQRSTCPCPLPP